MCRRKGSKRHPNYCGTTADQSKKVQKCFLVLRGRLADHKDHAALHNLACNCCRKCEVDPQSLVELQRFPPRDHTIYQQMIANYKRAQDHSQITHLAAVGLKVLTNGLWRLPCIRLSENHKLDLLHTVYLGLVKSLLAWITSFLKQHCRLNPFGYIWRSIPPYPGFTPPPKAFWEVSQWQRKEIRMLGRMVLPAMEIAIREPNPSQWYLFNRALECVRNVVDFHLMA